MIKTDCDAISVLITCKEITLSQKNSITQFLKLFGTGLTFRVGIPHNATGSKKDDSIFSCDSGTGISLPAYLQGKEALVIDSPVKIAVHQSCRKRIKESLDEQQYYLQLSPNKRVIFNARKCANNPPYCAMIKAIIESCYVEAERKHIIHVADFGMKQIVHPESADCEIRKLFHYLNNMRHVGLNVELLQIDIGFNIPVHNIVQMTLKSHNRDKNSVLFGSTLETFPIHQISKAKSAKEGPKVISGTILLKKGSKRLADHSQQDIEISDDYGSKPYLKLLSSLYNVGNESGLLHLKIKWSTIYSVKMYSTISHILMQLRDRFPLKWHEMYHIGESSFIQLQTLVKNMEHIWNEARMIVQNKGICCRIEVSIRPNHDDDMRSVGHYNDFLLHTLLTIHDIFNKDLYHFNMNSLNPEIIHSRFLKMRSQVMQHLVVRASSKFRRIYPNLRVTEWLRANISLLLIFIGFAPSYGLKFINKWLHDEYRYDPHEQAKNLIFNYQSLSEGNKISHSMVINRLVLALKALNVSKNGQETLKKLMSDLRRGCNALTYYERLSLPNKLRLASGLIKVVIPEIARLMSQFSNEEKLKDDDWYAKNKPKHNVEDIDCS
jgi:hypothetical protein